MTGMNGRSRKGFISYFCLRESPKQKIHVPRHRISALHRKQIQIAQLCCLLEKKKKRKGKHPHLCHTRPMNCLGSYKGLHYQRQNWNGSSCLRFSKNRQDNNNTLKTLFGQLCYTKLKRIILRNY